MPNKTVGFLTYTLHNLRRRISTYFGNHRIYYTLKNLELPYNIAYDVEIRHPDQVTIKREATIKSRTIIDGRSLKVSHGIVLGDNTYIKENCYFDAYGGFIYIGGCCAFSQNTIIHGGGGVTIGRYVITGANCYIISSNHNFASTELPIILQGDRRTGINIGDNVWIGGGVIILDGVNIGNNCVIGAGTIVTKSIPSNSLVYNRLNTQERSIYQ